MAIDLTWRLTEIGGETRPNDGSCFDGEADVGRVVEVTFGAKTGSWSWSMTASGHGANYPLHRGEEPTREEAKQAVETCYRNLMAAHADNRERWQEHCARVQWSMETFRNRGRRA